MLQVVVDWMLSEMVRPYQRPVTNVVVVFIIAATFIATKREIGSFWW